MSYQPSLARPEIAAASRSRDAHRRRARRGLEARGDPRGDPPPRGELADDDHLPRPAGGDEVVEDGVDGMLVEDPPVPVRLDRYSFRLFSSMQAAPGT